MEDYFNATLDKLRSENYNEINIVIGNESCDLDSAVSSIVYALFLHWQYEQIKCKVCTKGNRDETAYRDDIFVPILNVDREDYELKTEVAFFLRKNGINDNWLVFRNDYDLNAIVTSKLVKVTLVDHHGLAAIDKFLASHVTEIIDHRPVDKSEWSYSDDVRCTIEIVGSCCTLVAQRIEDLSVLIAKDVDFFNTYPVCSNMLYSTIILDTVNFSRSLNKATHHDEQIVMFLETLMKPDNYEAERANTLRDLTSAKSDVSSLSAAQLLRKDVKVFGNVLVPSFPILVRAFLDKPNVSEALAEAILKKNCSSVLLLGMDLKEGMKRDTAIYASEKAVADRLDTFLTQWRDPFLELNPLPPPAPTQHYYKQNNLSATRKQYIPILGAFMENKL